MARGPLGRTVARAARTGGTRSSRGPRQTPLGFYTTLVVVVLLGIAGVAFSRYEVLHPATAPSNAPTIGDHWLVAFDFDICGKVQPNPPKNPGKVIPGIYTTGNGLIQVVPKTKADTGKNATLGRFVSQYPGMVLSAASVGYPGQKVLHNGDLCGKVPGKVEVKVFSSLADTTGTLVTGNPDNLKLVNAELIAIAFVAPGTSIARPPSGSLLVETPPATATTPATTAKTTATTAKTAKPTAKTTAPTTHS
jgi:hypothetical protein